MTRLVVGLAIAQVLDALVGSAVPRRYVDAHLDHLGVPAGVRPALGAIKLVGSAGVLAGLRWPKIGTLTAAGLVSYYSAAVTFHVLSGDHPVLAAPAAGFGVAAAVVAIQRDHTVAT